MRVNCALGETTFARFLRMIIILPLLLVMALTACEGGSSPERDVSERPTRPPTAAATLPTAPAQEPALTPKPAATEEAATPRSEPVARVPVAGDGRATPPARAFATVGAPTSGPAATEEAATPRSEPAASVPSADDGDVTPPSGEFASVSVGDAHACGIRQDGTVECWGPGFKDDRVAPPSGEFASVSVGGANTCGVKVDGTVECWGPGFLVEVEPPAGEFASVSVGAHTIWHVRACGVRQDGSVECWGRDFHGDQAESPVGEFTSVSAYWHTCGVRMDGTVECWGNNPYGEATPPAGEFASVSVGNGPICGVRTDGTVECWGTEYIELYVEAMLPTGKFVSVSGGLLACGVKVDGSVKCWGSASVPENSHTCGVKVDGSVECWGNDEHGQATPPAGNFVSVSTGSYHTCGVKVDGSVECWGLNYGGQATPPAGGFTSVSAGDGYTCGVKMDGFVECWGSIIDRQGNLVGLAEPPAGKFVSISAGGDHTCGVKVDGSVECWFSDGSVRYTPPSGEFTSVSAGSGDACGMKVDGSVECWGHYTNEFMMWAGRWAGELASVSIGSYHICGLRRDGSVDCWGGGFQDESPPAGKFTSVSAGDSHTCGVKVGGSVECWGDNRFGQASPPDGEFATVGGPVPGPTIIVDAPTPEPGPTETPGEGRRPRVVLTPAPRAVLKADREALVDLHNLTGGGASGGWEWEKLQDRESGCSRWEVDNDNSDVSEWCGVTVDSNGRVTRLELAGNNLNNGIRKLGVLIGHHKLAMLGDLTGLTYLDLSGNDLSSALPPELDQLTKLTHLDLSGNAFRGDISKQNPDHPRGIEWEKLVNLVEMDLSDNRRSGQHGLSGRIPPELGFLPDLTALDLSGNNLEGAVPPTLAGLELDRNKSSLLKNPKLTCKPEGFAVAAYLDNCTDKHWLEDLYHTAGGEHWREDANWVSNNPISQWHGVITAPEEPNKVIGLFLSGNELDGDFDTVLGVLSGFEDMTHTDLSKNPLVSDDPLGFKAKILDTEWGTRFKVTQGTYRLITGEATLADKAKLIGELSDLALQIPEISNQRRLSGMLSSLSEGISKGGQWFDVVVEVAQYAQLFSVLHSLDLTDVRGTHDAVYNFLEIPEGARHYPLEEAMWLSCVADYPQTPNSQLWMVCGETPK